MYAASRLRVRTTTVLGVTVLGVALTAAACGGSSAQVDAPVASTTTPPTQQVETEEDVSVNEPTPSDEPLATEPVSASAPSTEPASTSVATTSPPPTDPACRRFTDFEDGTGWFIVNDGVMGGRSNGSFDVEGSVLSFTGDVVTAGGGFTSIRFPLAGAEMSGSTSVALRVRTDERVYGLTLEDDARANGRSVSHRADLDTTGPAEDGWQVVTVAYADLTPSVFGREVDAPPFDPDTAREFGIIIADGTDGAFALDIDWIDVCD